MKNFITQWINESTRFRGEEASLRLGLAFTKVPDIIEDMKLKSSIGKRDHVLSEFKLSRGRMETRNKDHKTVRCNYCKTINAELRKFSK